MRILLILPILLSLSATAAQAQTAVTAPTVTLTPPQRAAVVLGRWETCIDVSARFLTDGARRPARVAAWSQSRCQEYRARLQPVMAESLRAMMYGSSEAQVASETGKAMEAIDRHIQTYAQSAADKAQVAWRKGELRGPTNRPAEGPEVADTELKPQR